MTLFQETIAKLKEEKFELDKTIRKIDYYLNSQHKHPFEKNINKPFYSLEENEWSGWRFYKKALIYRDWRSIWWHIFKR